MRPSKEELKKLYYNDKKTFEEIGKQFKVSKTTVCRWFKKFDLESIKIPRNKLALSKELLIEYYVHRNMSMTEIANELSVNRVTVSKWLRTYNIEIKNCKHESPDKKELKDLYLNKFKTLDEIASIYNTNRNIVSRWLKENDIEIRLFNKKIEKPTKDILIKMYQVEKLTINNIANFYNTNRSVVTRWFQGYDIPIKSNQRKFYHLKAVPLEKDQKEFLIGTLLGDGCLQINKKKTKARLCLTHSIKQANYFFWKKRIMGNFINNTQVNAESKRNSVKMQCASIYHNNLIYYYNLFYDNNKKIIKEDIVNHLTPLAMAVWVMDDGWKNHSNIRISSEGFSKKENEILKKAIKFNFDINCKVVEYCKNKKKYYYLSFNKRNSELLTDLIQSHVIDCMKYKLITRSSTTKCKTPDLKPTFSSWREEWKYLKEKYKSRKMI